MTASDTAFAPDWAAAGAVLYAGKGCVACHALDERQVGPALRGVSIRRAWPWFRGMVLEPDSMLAVDPVAQALLEVYTVPMPDRMLSEAEARALWEYFRGLDLDVPAGTASRP